MQGMFYNETVSIFMHRRNAGIGISPDLSRGLNGPENMECNS